MTIEHRLLKSKSPEKAQDFENCLFACRFCNRARGRKPTEIRGARLLDPSREAWADHFEMVADCLQPKVGDADAKYTHSAYDLDDPVKVSRREARRELLADRLLLLSEIGTELVQLLDLADRLRRQRSPKLETLWKAILDLRRQAQRALQVLGLYQGIPGDAPTSCRCDPQQELALPEALEDQLIEVGAS